MPYRLRKKLGQSVCYFIEEIIDGMQDSVRVIGRDGTVLFVNKAMEQTLGKDIIGKKCYELLGHTCPCDNCVSKYAIEGCFCSKEEKINGRTFAVTSSPLRSDKDDSIEAVVEVLHDITELKELSIELKIQNQKLKQDLAMARRLQCSLLPKQQPLNDKIDFSFIYRPCDTLGGDFLDIFRIDENHIGVYIADVSGHGVAASMLTMFLRTALNKSTFSPAEALTQLYEYYNRNNFADELYIAVFYGIINTADYTVTYSNAGLNVCPIIYSRNSFKILRAPGIPISNWVENPSYTEFTESIRPRDKIFFSTDGIIELKNPENSQFGEDRILEHLLESDFEPAHTLSELIDKAIVFSTGKNADDNSDNSSIIDDITVALIEIK